MKTNSIITKIACKLIGWNPTILAECGEASHRALKKYISAITIMAVIWGTIGYLFADRYIGVDSTIVKIATSIVFITIVVCIERFIILKVGKSSSTAVMRIVLAVLMATLGATIFDQMIFRNDLAVKMTQERDKEAVKTLANRVIILDKQAKENQLLVDSLNRECEKRLNEANNKPYITSVVRRQEQVLIGTDSLGNNVYETRSNYDTKQEPNPKFAQAQSIAEMRDKYINQGKELNQKMLTLEDSVRKEVSSKPTGFLEELKVLFREIIFKDNIAAAFYIILFLFMLSLEILVVTSKIGETTCDYDLLVEHQLKVKEITLKRTLEQLTK